MSVPDLNTPDLSVADVVAETATCRQCRHRIARSEEHWNKEWRCTQGCRGCVMMIGCVPDRRPDAPAPRHTVV